MQLPQKPWEGRERDRSNSLEDRMLRLGIRLLPTFCNIESPNRYFNSTEEPYQILNKGYADHNEKKEQQRDSQETFEPKQSFNNNGHENDKT